MNTKTGGCFPSSDCIILPFCSSNSPSSKGHGQFNGAFLATNTVNSMSGSVVRRDSHVIKELREYILLKSRESGEYVRLKFKQLGEYIRLKVKNLGEYVRL